jgi:hypothetical protein
LYCAQKSSRLWNPGQLAPGPSSFAATHVRAPQPWQYTLIFES